MLNALVLLIGSIAVKGFHFLHKRAKRRHEAFKKIYVGIRDEHLAEHFQPQSKLYSFGVLLLELLTGKQPIQSPVTGDMVNLPRWVQSDVREEWTSEVFDVDLMRFHNIEEEMMQMLQIGLGCVVRVPENRPSMYEVVGMMEQVRIRSPSD